MCVDCRSIHERQCYIICWIVTGTKKFLNIVYLIFVISYTNSSFIILLLLWLKAAYYNVIGCHVIDHTPTHTHSSTKFYISHIKCYFYFVINVFFLYAVTISNIPKTYWVWWSVTQVSNPVQTPRSHQGLVTFVLFYLLMDLCERKIKPFVIIVNIFR